MQFVRMVSLVTECVACVRIVR